MLATVISSTLPPAGEGLFELEIRDCIVRHVPVPTNAAPPGGNQALLAVLSCAQGVAASILGSLVRSSTVPCSPGKVVYISGRTRMGAQGGYLHAPSCAQKWRSALLMASLVCSRAHWAASLGFAVTLLTLELELQTTPQEMMPLQLELLLESVNPLQGRAAMTAQRRA